MKRTNPRQSKLVPLIFDIKWSLMLKLWGDCSSNMKNRKVMDICNSTELMTQWLSTLQHSTKNHFNSTACADALNPTMCPKPFEKVWLILSASFPGPDWLLVPRKKLSSKILEETRSRPPSTSESCKRPSWKRSRKSREGPLLDYGDCWYKTKKIPGTTEALSLRTYR